MSTVAHRRPGAERGAAEVSSDAAPVMAMEPAIFLDRDNTLIANDGDLGDPAHVRLLDGVGPALRALREAGYRLVVVTNQGGVARGLYGERDVDAVHQRIAQLVDEATGLRGVIDRFYYCPFHPEARVEEYRRDHPWRKPNPGMLLQAAHDMSLDLPASWLIGDQARDVVAGRAAGCRTVLVRTPRNAVAGSLSIEPTITASSLLEAAHRILDGAVDTPHAAADRPRDVPAPSPAGEALGRAMQDLAEEMRTSRARRLEFTPTLLAATLVQLVALLLATLGLLQAGEFEPFVKWMAGAGLVQLLVITLLVLDQRG